MKRIYNFILLVCLVQLAVAQNRIAEIRENLLGNYSDRVLVVSHRADWRNAPENSLQGIRNCIDMGVDMVEIDLKKTKPDHRIRRMFHIIFIPRLRHQQTPGGIVFL